MLFRVDKRRFLLRKIAPEQKNDAAELVADLLDHRVRKSLPAIGAVRVGLVFAGNFTTIAFKHHIT